MSEEHNTSGSKILVFVWLAWFVFLYVTNWIALSDNWFIG
jgi:hypothetical protein